MHFSTHVVEEQFRRREKLMGTLYVQETLMASTTSGPTRVHAHDGAPHGCTVSHSAIEKVTPRGASKSRADAPFYIITVPPPC